jgi:hypothetical protein
MNGTRIEARLATKVPADMWPPVTVIANRGVLVYLTGWVKEPLFFLPLARKALHNLSISQTCHPERKRRITFFLRSFKAFDKSRFFSSRRNTPLLQNDNVRGFVDYAKVSLLRGTKDRGQATTGKRIAGDHGEANKEQ